MNMHTKLRAVVNISNNSENEHNDLKRLALFFDEIHYILPSSITLKREVMDEVQRRKGVNSQKPLEISFFRDTYKGLHLAIESLKSHALKETLLTFTEAGIAKEINEPAQDNEFELVKNAMANFDMRDAYFNQLCKTVDEDYEKISIEQFLTIKVLETNEQIKIATLKVPKTILDSFEITTTFYLSNKHSFIPIFLNPQTKRKLEHRYTQYKRGLEALKNFSSEIISPTDFKTTFGEVTFNVADTLLTSELMSNKTPDQIIKYRNAMSDARLHFISENLMEISSIIQDNPWNAQTKDEIEKYIMGKLNQNILLYNESCYETWEKLFGNFAVHTGQIIKSGAIGTGAGLVGSLIPNTSAWHMLLIGALTGIAVEAPNVAKSLAETILEKRKEKRSSIAYIANFK